MSIYRKYVLLLAVCVSVIAVPGILYAEGTTEVASVDPIITEQINSFDASIEIQENNDILVYETIEYSTGSESKHGIYRDIRTRSENNIPLKVEIIEVINENSESQPYVTNQMGGSLRVKIGDPNSVFTGTKTYFIAYRVKDAISQYSDHNELYWNITGNKWKFPIINSRVRVLLPNNTLTDEIWCYGTGLSAEISQCSVDLESKISTFNHSILPGKHFTIKVLFDKNLVIPYAPGHHRLQLVRRIIPGVIAVLIFGFVFTITYRRWLKKGKDPESSDVVVTEFSAPDNLSPAEASVIMKERVTNNALVAEIIQLAVDGYISIKSVDSSNSDYEIRVVRTLPKEASVTQRYVKGAIFGGAKKVLLSQFRKKMVISKRVLNKKILKDLKKRGYYNNLDGIFNIGLVLLFGAIIASFKILIRIGYPIIQVSLWLSCITMVLFDGIGKTKTEKGMEVYDKLRGYKKYLSVAEKDRLDFVNAPQKNPETFEKGLPYAILFGVEEEWVKEFDSICTQDPIWFTNGKTNSFYRPNFSIGITNFCSNAQPSFASYYVASRSGTAGGHAGGGGGGGGGGSW